jgi:hypothetical protein
MTREQQQVLLQGKNLLFKGSPAYKTTVLEAPKARNDKPVVPEYLHQKGPSRNCIGMVN